MKKSRNQSLEEIDSVIIDLENQLKIAEIDPYNLIEKTYTIHSGISDQELLARPSEELPEITERKIDIYRRIAELKKKRIRLKKNSSDKHKILNLKISFSRNLYDSSASILRLKDEEIKLPIDRNEDYLCRVIFANEKNMKKEWLCVDVIKKSKDRIISRSQNPEKELWRPVYNATRKLNNRIALAVGMKDFFLLDSIKTVRINPEYLV